MQKYFALIKQTNEKRIKLETKTPVIIVEIFDVKFFQFLM
jgi:hypothetical protein